MASGQCGRPPPARHRRNQTPVGERIIVVLSKHSPARIYSSSNPWERTVASRQFSSTMRRTSPAHSGRDLCRDLDRHPPPPPPAGWSGAGKTSSVTVPMSAAGRDPGRAEPCRRSAAAGAARRAGQRVRFRPRAAAGRTPLPIRRAPRRLPSRHPPHLPPARTPPPTAPARLRICARAASGLTSMLAAIDVDRGSGRYVEGQPLVAALRRHARRIGEVVAAREPARIEAVNTDSSRSLGR